MDIEVSTLLTDVCQVSSSITMANDIDTLIHIVENDIRNLIPYDKAIYVLAKRDGLQVVKTIRHNYSKSDLSLIIDNRNRIKNSVLLNPFAIENHRDQILGSASYGFHEHEGNYVSLFHCSSTCRRATSNINNTKILEIIIPRLHSTFLKLYRSMMLNNGLPIKPLSPRESEIITWISKGKTNHEIGVILGISTYTVKNHVSNILEKLNVANRAEALIKANVYCY